MSTQNPIPDFDHNLVLPPHRGDPRIRADLSPYPCTTLDLCQRFATSPERVEILTGFLDFRAQLESQSLTTGFQWIDGSFLEDVEAREKRAPNDLDVVTVYWGYDGPFQQQVVNAFPEFGDRQLAKQNYRVDHFPFDASHSPTTTVEFTRYWMQLFTHNRDSVWKGMLRIDLGTPTIDTEGRRHLSGLSS